MTCTIRTIRSKSIANSLTVKTVNKSNVKNGSEPTCPKGSNLNFDKIYGVNISSEHHHQPGSIRQLRRTDHTTNDNLANHRHYFCRCNSISFILQTIPKWHEPISYQWWARPTLWADTKSLPFSMICWIWTCPRSNKQQRERSPVSSRNTFFQEAFNCRESIGKQGPYPQK